MTDALRRNDRWLYLTIPYQIAYGPVSSLIILYILDLHGTVIDASYAIMLSNLVWIFAGLFWGRLIDTYNRRRLFIALSLAGLAGSLAALYLFRSVTMVILAYGFLSFMVIANATPVNLLVMETSARERWAEGFSKLQMFMSVGGMAGFLLVTVLSGLMGIGTVLLLLAPFALVALLMTSLISEPARPMSRRAIFDSMHALSSRLMTSHILFAGRKTLERLERYVEDTLSRGVRMPAATNLNMLYAAALLFSVSGVLFNTAYPAGLKSIGLDNFQVLLVLLMGMIVQTVVFYHSGVLSERHAKMQVSVSSMAVRGLAYAGMGAAFLVLGRFQNFVLGFLLYPIAAGAAYALFFTAFNTMLFESLGTERQGRKLGFYSAITGVGSLFGALMAGYVSFYVGYWVAFVVAGALALLTAYLIFMMPRFDKPAAARSAVPAPAGSVAGKA